MSRLIAKGSTALVTGCSSGLGLELVRLLLDQGLHVWGISRTRPKVDSPECFRWQKSDLADSAALHPVLIQIIREANGIDLVVNNAGFGSVGILPESSVDEIEASLRVMLLAPVLTTRFFLRGGEAEDGDAWPMPAVIVNTSSLAAGLPIPLMPTYNAAKAGLSGFTLSMALDRAAYPETRFIDFCPGDYRTPFADAFGGGGDPERRAYVERLAKHHARAPGPKRAAADLWRAIQRGKEGTVRSGAFFQATVAPLGVRLFPSAWLRATIRRYYGITG